MYVYFLGIGVVDGGLDQEVEDVEGQKVVIDIVDLEVMIEDGQEGVKNEKDIEEMIDVIMIVEMIIVLAVVPREEIDGQTKEKVLLEGKLNKERVQLEKK